MRNEGKLRMADDAAERGSAVARPDPALRMYCANARGTLLFSRGLHAAAHESFLRARDLAEELDHPRHAVHIAINLGQVLFELERPRQARETLNRARDLAASRGMAAFETSARRALRASEGR